jgi:protein kinase C substrate 80K-H
MIIGGKSDGSDEAPGLCPNTCEEQYKVVREKQAAEAKERADGLKAREQLKKESQKAFWGLK